MTSTTIQTQSQEQTQRVAAAVAQGLGSGGVVALEGDLGAGKTIFVKGMAEQLGLDPTQVTSPTFTLIDEHDLPDGRILIHVDAWRLGSDEVSEVGLQEHLSSDRTIVAIEWAQRIADVLPPDHVKIVIEILDPERRSITITPMGDAACVIESPGVCPVCNEEASVATAPFCTSRCRLVDLGQWFDGRHVIHRPIGEDDLLE